MNERRVLLCCPDTRGLWTVDGRRRKRANCESVDRQTNGLGGRISESVYACSASCQTYEVRISIRISHRPEQEACALSTVYLRVMIGGKTFSVRVSH